MSSASGQFQAKKANALSGDLHRQTGSKGGWQVGHSVKARKAEGVKGKGALAGKGEAITQGGLNSLGAISADEKDAGGQALSANVHFASNLQNLSHDIRRIKTKGKAAGSKQAGPVGSKQAPKNLSMKAVAKAAAQAAVDVAGEAEETKGLEQATSAFRTAKAGKDLISKMKTRKDAGKVAEAAGKTNEALKNRYARRAIIKAKQVKETAKSANATRQAASRAAALVGGAAKSGMGATAAVISAPALLVIVMLVVILLVLSLLFMGGGGAAAEQQQQQSADAPALSGNALQVYLYLAAKKVPDIQIAAIMGNMQQENNFQTDDSAAGLGLCQWIGSRKDALSRYAQKQQKATTDLQIQLDFLWAEMCGKGPAASYATDQLDYKTFSALQTVGDANTWAAFVAAGYSQAKDATTYFCAHFERPGSTANWINYAHCGDHRIPYAQDWYGQIRVFAVGGSAVQQKIVAAAYSQLGVPYVWGGNTPFEGVGDINRCGLDCSGLAAYCYFKAGVKAFLNTEDPYQEGVGKNWKNQTSASLHANCDKDIPVSTYKDIYAKARPGDMLWHQGHVVVYIGGDSYIEEPQPGEVCKVSSVKQAMTNPAWTPFSDILHWEEVYPYSAQKGGK